MAVTVGAEVDRLLARYGKLSVAKAVVMQAAAAAMVEAYCNELNAMWKKEYLKKRALSETKIFTGLRRFSAIGPETDP